MIFLNIYCNSKNSVCTSELLRDFLVFGTLVLLALRTATVKKKDAAVCVINT